jgi:diguanylate cyclase (GGDEF)-like protein/PAS domain S-box-containing protein
MEMDVVVDGFSEAPASLDQREQVQAWYAIRYESIVDTVESVLLAHAVEAERPVSIRSLVHGRLQILIQSALLDTRSHMYIRDVGADFAHLCGGSLDALTDLRLVMNRKLVEELPGGLSGTIAPAIERMLTEILWGYATTASEIEREQTIAAPAPADPAYVLEPEGYAALVAQAPNAVAIFHAVNGDFLAGNDRLVEMFGYSLAEFDRLPNDQVYTSETPEDDFDKGVELMAGRIRSFSRETAWRHKDGSTVWCEMTNWLVRDGDGQPHFLVCTYVPLRNGHTEETHWQRADKRFRYLAQLSVDPTFIIDVDHTVRYASPATERTLGIDPEELVGHRLTDLILEEDRGRYTILYDALEGRPRHTERTELRINRRDGQWRWFEMTATNLLDVPEVEGYSFQARDVSDRKLVEQLLAQQALFDPLTNLLNRRGMLERLDRALQQAAVNRESLCVLYIDLDNFKQVNDRFGHEAGDNTLMVAANRLAGAVGTAGIVARWGGDEFIVAIEDANPLLVDTIVQRILAAMAEPVEIGSIIVTLMASIGKASAHPELHEHGPMSLLRAADASLYEAKAARARTHDSTGGHPGRLQ